MTTEAKEAKEAIQHYVRTIEKIYERYEPGLPNSETDPYTKDELTMSLLTDLLHYCKANDISFMCQLDLATKSFVKERAKAAGKHKRLPPKRMAKRKMPDIEL